MKLKNQRKLFEKLSKLPHSDLVNKIIDMKINKNKL